MRFPAKYSIPGAIVGTLIALEVILRLVFGLGTPVLVQADADTGYRFKANQKLVRFGKRVEYNQHSQRSEPLNRQPQGRLRILMTGDSVLNGGNPTDQQQTITELFEDKLFTSGLSAEILNASAGSWGIGNQLGYLRNFGTFNSAAVILQIGTHDLTQPTSTSDPVGRDPNYPASPPLLALQEVWMRYVWPRLQPPLGLSAPVVEASPPNPDQQFLKNLQAIKAIARLARAQQIPLFVLFTPERNNLIPAPNTPKYKVQFLRELKSFQIPLVDTQAAWARRPTTEVETYFRDSVHLSVLGNQAVADVLFAELCGAGELSACSNLPQ